MADDLSSLKDIMEEIEKMTAISSAWIPTRHFARGEFHRIRGDHPGALAELKEALRITAPGRHQFWAPSADAYLKTLLAQQKYEQVKSEAKKFLQQAEAADLGYICSYLRVSLAVAQAKLNDADSAVKNAEAVLESFNAIGATGLNLGLAYETRARVALLMNDEPKFVHYAKLCAQQYRVSENSCLRAKYERLMQKARQAELTIPPMCHGITIQKIERETDKIYMETRAQLDSYENSDKRAERALEILAEHCEAKGGILFGLQVEGLEMLSNYKKDSVPAQLIETVNAYLEAELKDSTEATITVADENAADGSNPSVVLEDGTVVELVLLHGLQQKQPVVVGVAALIPAHWHLLAINPQVIRAISDALLENGEVTSRIAA